jgi:hypothetical protein
MGISRLQTFSFDGLGREAFSEPEIHYVVMFQRVEADSLEPGTWPAIDPFECRRVQ